MDEVDKVLLDRCLHALAANLSWWIYDPKRSLPRFLDTNYELDPVVKVEISYKIRKIIEPTEADMTQKATMVATLSYQNPRTKEMVKKRAFILCFRGTTSASDWLTNLGATPNKQAFKDCGLHVHSGWLSLVHCDNLIESFLEALTEENQSPLDSVLISGHSMGGALAQVTATLAYSYAKKRQPAECSEQKGRIHDLLTQAMRCLLTEKLSCVTLAAPQPFADPSQEELLKWTQWRKKAFKETMEWMDRHMVNYVNGNDLVARVPGNLEFVIGMLKNAPWMRVSHQFLPAPYVSYTFQAADLAQQWKESCKQLKLYRPVGKTVYIGHASQSDLMTSIPKDPEVVKISTMAGLYDACAAYYDHQVTTYADRIHCKRAVKSHLFGHQSGIWQDKVNPFNGVRSEGEGDWFWGDGKFVGVKVDRVARYEGKWDDRKFYGVIIWDHQNTEWLYEQKRHAFCTVTWHDMARHG